VIIITKKQGTRGCVAAKISLITRNFVCFSESNRALLGQADSKFQSKNRAGGSKKWFLPSPNAMYVLSECVLDVGHGIEDAGRCCEHKTWQCKYFQQSMLSAALITDILTTYWAEVAWFG
jgi:hypothetical protein